MGDMFERLQRGLGKTKIGQRVNNAIRGARNLAGKARRVARSVGNALNKTKTGRAVTGMARKAFGKVANSGFGKAVAGAAGTVAGGAVASGGTASVAAGSGATAAAGAAGAAGAAALSNPVGIAVAAVVAAFAGLAIATKVLNDTFTSEADRLEKYSASIGIARGNQRINTELNMIDRARRLSGPLGGLENSKTALNDSMEKLWTEILTILSGYAPYLAKGVDLLTLLSQAAREAALLTEAGLAGVQLAIARQTPQINDDMAAVQRISEIAVAQNKLVNEIAATVERLSGNAPRQVNGRDPMLMSLLNAKVGP
jgi:hypothetical protein